MKPSLTIITPVGPGHQLVVDRAVASAQIAKYQHAWNQYLHFGSVSHEIFDDSQGRLGCAGSKNVAMDLHTESDWYFFLDADDLMEPDALTLNDFDAPATFGAVKLRRWPHAKNVWPCGFRELAIHGAGGTLTVGFFVRGDVARALRFKDEDDTTDDFDFYLRLPGFTKIRQPLVTTCDDIPSATGPRRVGHKENDWTGMCNELIRQAVARDPAKFGIEPGELLSQVAPTGWQPAA